MISFFSVEFPYESHAFRGSLMDGNIEHFKLSSDRVLSVDYVPKNISKDGRSYVNEEYYLDAFGNRISFNGNRRLKKAFTK